MEIDPVTSTLIPGPGFGGNAMQAPLKAAQLQPHIDAVVANANAIDAELAEAITTNTTAPAIGNGGSGFTMLDDKVEPGEPGEGEEGPLLIWHCLERQISSSWPRV